MNGADILDRLRAILREYVVIPSDAATDAVVLWIAATHAIHLWINATRLIIKSPEKRCGKTRFLEVIALLVWRPLMTSNATTPAIFRSLEGDQPPTLLFDEIDAVFGTQLKAESNEDLRSLLNAGFGRNRPVLRTVGPNHVVTPFNTFAMAALVGIGNLPDTIEDRAVIVTMRRRAPDEIVKPYRERRDRPQFDSLRAELAEWVASVEAELADAEPELPVEDRAGDVFESLAAIADAAGGRWPAAARSAALVLTAAANQDDTDRSYGVRLLADVQSVFAASPGAAFISSADLTAQLRRLEDSPWLEFDLKPRGLATRLRPYGIKAGHNSAKTERGYRLEALQDAFSRYLPVERPQASERPDPPEPLGEPPDDDEPPDEWVRPHLAAVPADSDARTDTDGKPVCTGCGKANLFAPASIERGVCAACIQRSTA